MLDVSKSRHIADAGEGSASEVSPAQRFQIVLVFQGGGALGAYQAGVYQALHEGGIEPDWIIGTSIGAINASLIAGNEPEHRLDRLEEFWRRMKRKEFWGLVNWPGLADTASYWSTLLAGIPGFFKPTRWPFSARTIRSDGTAPASTRPNRWRRRSPSWSTLRSSNAARHD
jgi:predicted acylesterase/phospholipase RssA